MLKDEDYDDPVSKIQVRSDGNSSPIDPQLVRAASKILKEISLKSIFSCSLYLSAGIILKIPEQFLSQCIKICRNRERNS